MDFCTNVAMQQRRRGRFTVRYWATQKVKFLRTGINRSVGMSGLGMGNYFDGKSCLLKGDENFIIYYYMKIQVYIQY